MGHAWRSTLILPILWATLVAAAEPTRYPDVRATASSRAGEKYDVANALDGSTATRWASRDQPTLPQWVELRVDEPVPVDHIEIQIAVDKLYASWAAFELSFSHGDPIVHRIDKNEDRVAFHFPARETSFVRITITEVHEPRHYVGILSCAIAFDPDRQITRRARSPRPVAKDDILIRGRSDHPCVNLTRQDVARARQRVDTMDWAREYRDDVLQEAEGWLREEDAYWLAFLPEPGACYAYGFTACPICDGKTGTWHGARCSWEEPGKVTCSTGHTLPDDAHPDRGTGFTAADGRIHYFVGQFNAWATEQWTQHALPALTEAYVLTGDERYAQRAALLLDALASIYKESTSGSWDYPSNPPSGRFARPWYQVARTLVRYVDFYDRLYHSPVMETPSIRPNFTKRDNIEQNMLLDGAYYCYEHAFAGTLHNGHADYLRGALAVGCLLDIPEYIRVAVDGPFSIFTMLSNNIDRDGRYYESSLGYGIHARELYLTFADPLVNLRNAEYPKGLNLYDDARLQAAILLPDAQVTLAGRRPNFGDSAPDVRYLTPGPVQPNESDLAFLERLHGRTSDPEREAEYAALLQWAGGEGWNPDSPLGEVEWALFHARLPVPVSPPPLRLPAPYEQRLNGAWVSGMKGMAMLRSGDKAVLLRFGPSLNHGDPDDLGLHFYANGYEITYDLGYGLGSTHAHVGWASSTVSHALVTVDETNQLVGDGSGGSLRWFAALPHVQAVEAESANSYSAIGVTEYRRALALVDGTYLVDLFHVVGGGQHDFGFGGIGTALEPFGVAGLETRDGSLAEGYDWGTRVGPDGDITGYPNKPYWNPPPGNGYGFFKNVRAGKPAGHWGGEWTIPGEPGARMKMHIVGDVDEAIFADAPGLYPSKPESSYVMARRGGAAPLSSTFLAVYEPKGAAPELGQLRRVGPAALEVPRGGDVVDVILFGAQRADTVAGVVEFDGHFAYLQFQQGEIQRWETHGSKALALNGVPLGDVPGVFAAEIVALDQDERRVRLSTAPPHGVNSGLVALFSNSAYNRNAAYHIRKVEDDWLYLETGSLTLGVGRVWDVRDPTTILSDVPHEYARHVRQRPSRFFDGKLIEGEGGGRTRVQGVMPGTPLTLTVEDANALKPGEQFTYLDIAPGDRVHIALPEVSGGIVPASR